MIGSEPYKIRSNDRVAFIGKTGSGKTYACKKLVWEPMPDVIFYDIKGEEYRDLNAPVLTSLDEVHEALFPDNPEEHLTKFVFRPRRTSLEQFDRLCKYVFEHGNMHLVADELKALYQQGNGSKPITEYHNDIMVQGRSRGVGMSNNTQRPKRIPLEAMSEAEHIFTFKLKVKDDRERLKGIYGEPAEQARDLTNYRYVYDHDNLDRATVCEPL